MTGFAPQRLVSVSLSLPRFESTILWLTLGVILTHLGEDIRVKSCPA